MNNRTIQLGVATGVIGGLVMAAFAMTTMALTGHGFWTVVNVIAHTFWKGAPLDGAFSPGAALLGVAIHLVVSTIVGTVIAEFVMRGDLDGGVIFLVALGIGVVAWVVQTFAWPAIDPTSHQAFTAWVLAAAHAVFGVSTALVLKRLAPVARGAVRGARAVLDAA